MIAHFNFVLGADPGAQPDLPANTLSETPHNDPVTTAMDEPGYVNNYTQPAGTGNPWIPRILPDAELYGPDPYDINFAFPLHAETLQSDRLKLVPFVPPRPLQEGAPNND